MRVGGGGGGGGGEEPMKSKPQQTKISIIKIGVRGIMFLFVIPPNYWHRAQVLKKSKQSLKRVG